MKGKLLTRNLRNQCRYFSFYYWVDTTIQPVVKVMRARASFMASDFNRRWP